MTVNERQAKWKEYKTAWLQGSSMTMSAGEFTDIFYDGTCSKEAVELAHSNSFVFRMLLNAAQGVTDHADSDVNAVWVAVINDDEIQLLYRAVRENILPGNRSSFVNNVVRNLVHHRGRQFVRNMAIHFWWQLSLLDEEREGLVFGLLNGGIREPEFFKNLSSDAFRYALRHGGLDPKINQSSVFTTTSNCNGSSHQERILVSRFDALLQDVSLPVDMKDACLRPAELYRLQQNTEFSSGSSGLAKALKNLRHHHGKHGFEFAEDIVKLISVYSSSHLIQTPTSTPLWHFPVLRMLHLQMILDTPKLANYVKDPALALIPDVALWLMGRDAIIYQPELRVLRESEKRWRARWAENAGEAVSVMFLEDSIQLDLSTLVRIPEKNDQPTPDFMAGTISNEKIVFEAKGSTRWSSHNSQKLQALKQLGKKQKTQAISWAGDGRTFACSLFAAKQGDERSSLLNVDDPPFQFDNIFTEGWKHHSRRDHAVAMLEAARLFGAADTIGHDKHINSDSNRIDTFEFPDADSEISGNRFVGKYLPIEEWADALRHPDTEFCKRIRIFVGLDERLYNSFLNHEFTTLRELNEMNADKLEHHTVRMPGIGLLPSRENKARPKGLYSLLSDGAFMAVEMNWME